MVNVRDDHLELRYGARQTPVARVGLDEHKHIRVQFLVAVREGNVASQEMLNDTRGELTYYLFSVAGPHAWAFGRFHCETPANFASRIRWSWHPGRTSAQIS